MKGLLVCNTGPLIALAIVDRIRILPDLFTSVIVPRAVHEEILAGGQQGFGLTSYQKAGWLNRFVLEKPLDPLLEALLDRGEAEVLQTAVSLNADWVLIDERKARKVARTVYDLSVVGTVGILIEAKRRGLIPEIGNLLIEMKEYGYRIHESIIERALFAVGEKDRIQ